MDAFEVIFGVKLALETSEKPTTHELMPYFLRCKDELQRIADEGDVDGGASLRSVLPNLCSLGLCFSMPKRSSFMIYG